MVMEDAPREDNPGWITAQSYLGLNRQVQILDENAANVEMLYLHCLRYGAYPSFPTFNDRNGKRVSDEMIAHNRELEKSYMPFIDMFRGKKWVFYPEALQLPENTNGNIYQLKDGTLMITMVSSWRSLRNAEGFDKNLQVITRLPDAKLIGKVEVFSVDGGTKSIEAAVRDGNKLTITVPKHGKATVILLHPKA